MLVVSNAMPVKPSRKHRHCKANPGKVSYALSGNGTSVHMSADVKALTKIDMVHVPYRGSAPRFPTSFPQGAVIFDNLPSALEQARGGTVRAPASPRRSKARRARCPAIAETVPGFKSVLWHLRAEGHFAGDY